nr:glycosyl hydrolase family 18 protein [Motilimonas eburnea]
MLFPAVMLLGLLLCQSPLYAAPLTGPLSVGVYQSAWSKDAAFSIDQVPAHYFTHLIYEQLDVNAQGEVQHWDEYLDLQAPFAGDTLDQTNKGSLNQLLRLKQQNPNLKTWIAIGGWRLSEHFAPVAADADKRRNLIQSTLAFVRQHQFDGVVLDWRYPMFHPDRPLDLQRHEAKDWLALVREFKQALTSSRSLLETSPPLQLVVAMPSWPVLLQPLPLAEAASYVDYFYLLNVDLAGAWSRYNGHASPLFWSEQNPEPFPASMDLAVQTMLNANVASRQIIVSTPAIGRSWRHAEQLYSASASATKGSLDNPTQKSGLLIQSEVNYLISQGYQQHWDEVAQASYLQQGDHFVSYESARALAAKLAYSQRHQLGGMALQYLFSDQQLSQQIFAFYYPWPYRWHLIHRHLLRFGWLYCLLLLAPFGWLFKRKQGALQAQLILRQQQLAQLHQQVTQLQTESSPLALPQAEQGMLAAMQQQVAYLDEQSDLNAALQRLLADPLIASLAKQHHMELGEPSQSGCLGDYLALVELCRGHIKSLSQDSKLLAELHQIASKKNQLLYLKAEQGYTGIYCQGQSDPIYIYSRLTPLLRYYGDDFLLQCHRSYLVNRERIMRVECDHQGKYWLYLQGDIDKHGIPVTAKYLASVQPYLVSQEDKLTVLT